MQRNEEKEIAKRQDKINRELDDILKGHFDKLTKTMLKQIARSLDPTAKDGKNQILFLRILLEHEKSGIVLGEKSSDGESRNEDASSTKEKVRRQTQRITEVLFKEFSTPNDAKAQISNLLLGTLVHAGTPEHLARPSDSIGTEIYAFMLYKELKATCSWLKIKLEEFGADKSKISGTAKDVLTKLRNMKREDFKKHIEKLQESKQTDIKLHEALKDLGVIKEKSVDDTRHDILNRYLGKTNYTISSESIPVSPGLEQKHKAEHFTSISPKEEKSAADVAAELFQSSKAKESKEIKDTKDKLPSSDDREDGEDKQLSGATIAETEQAEDAEAEVDAKAEKEAAEATARAEAAEKEAEAKEAAAKEAEAKAAEAAARAAEAEQKAQAAAEAAKTISEATIPAAVMPGASNSEDKKAEESKETKRPAEAETESKAVKTVTTATSSTHASPSGSAISDSSKDEKDETPKETKDAKDKLPISDDSKDDKNKQLSGATITETESKPDAKTIETASTATTSHTASTAVPSSVATDLSGRDKDQSDSKDEKIDTEEAKRLAFAEQKIIAKVKETLTSVFDKAIAKIEASNAYQGNVDEEEKYTPAEEIDLDKDLIDYDVYKQRISNSLENFKKAIIAAAITNQETARNTLIALGDLAISSEILESKAIEISNQFVKSLITQKTSDQLDVKTDDIAAFGIPAIPEITTTHIKELADEITKLNMKAQESRAAKLATDAKKAPEIKTSESKEQENKDDKDSKTESKTTGDTMNDRRTALVLEKLRAKLKECVYSPPDAKDAKSAATNVTDELIDLSAPFSGKTEDNTSSVIEATIKWIVANPSAELKGIEEDKAADSIANTVLDLFIRGDSDSTNQTDQQAKHLADAKIVSLNKSDIEKAQVFVELITPLHAVSRIMPGLKRSTVAPTPITPPADPAYTLATQVVAALVNELKRKYAPKDEKDAKSIGDFETFKEGKPIYTHVKNIVTSLGIDAKTTPDTINKIASAFSKLFIPQPDQSEPSQQECKTALGELLTSASSNIAPELGRFQTTASTFTAASLSLKSSPADEVKDDPVDKIMAEIDKSAANLFSLDQFQTYFGSKETFAKDEDETNGLDAYLEKTKDAWTNFRTKLEDAYKADSTQSLREATPGVEASKIITLLSQLITTGELKEDDDILKHLVTIPSSSTHTGFPFTASTTAAIAIAAIDDLKYGIINPRKDAMPLRTAGIKSILDKITPDYKTFDKDTYGSAEAIENEKRAKALWSKLDKIIRAHYSDVGLFLPLDKQLPDGTHTVSIFDKFIELLQKGGDESKGSPITPEKIQEILGIQADHIAKFNQHIQNAGQINLKLPDYNTHFKALTREFNMARIYGFIDKHINEVSKIVPDSFSVKVRAPETKLDSKEVQSTPSFVELKPTTDEQIAEIKKIQNKYQGITEDKNKPSIKTILLAAVRDAKSIDSQSIVPLNCLIDPTVVQLGLIDADEIKKNNLGLLATTFDHTVQTQLAQRIAKANRQYHHDYLHVLMPPKIPIKLADDTVTDVETHILALKKTIADAENGMLHLNLSIESEKDKYNRANQTIASIKAIIDHIEQNGLLELEKTRNKFKEKAADFVGISSKVTLVQLSELVTEAHTNYQKFAEAYKAKANELITADLKTLKAISPAITPQDPLLDISRLDEVTQFQQKSRVFLVKAGEQLKVQGEKIPGTETLLDEEPNFKKAWKGLPSRVPFKSISGLRDIMEKSLETTERGKLTGDAKFKTEYDTAKAALQRSGVPEDAIKSVFDLRLDIHNLGFKKDFLNNVRYLYIESYKILQQAYGNQDTVDRLPEAKSDIDGILERIKRELARDIFHANTKNWLTSMQGEFSKMQREMISLHKKGPIKTQVHTETIHSTNPAERQRIAELATSGLVSVGELNAWAGKRKFKTEPTDLKNGAAILVASAQFEPSRTNYNQIQHVDDKGYKGDVVCRIHPADADAKETKNAAFMFERLNTQTGVYDAALCEQQAVISDRYQLKKHLAKMAMTKGWSISIDGLPLVIPPCKASQLKDDKGRPANPLLYLDKAASDKLDEYINKLPPTISDAELSRHLSDPQGKGLKVDTHSRIRDNNSVVIDSFREALQDSRFHTVHFKNGEILDGPAIGSKKVLIPNLETCEDYEKFIAMLLTSKERKGKPITLMFNNPELLFVAACHKKLDPNFFVQNKISIMRGTAMPKVSDEVANALDAQHKKIHGVPFGIRTQSTVIRTSDKAKAFAEGSEFAGDKQQASDSKLRFR